MKHQKYVPVFSWCFIVYCTTRYWHKLLMLHSVLYNYILTHSYDVPSCTIELDTGTYYWCFVVYCTTRYWDIFLILHASDDSSYTIKPDTYIWFYIRNICQYLVVQYMKKYQKYVPVCSCTVHDKASVICASIWLYSTRWIINNMSQYLVVQYMEKDQKYVPESSCTITYETSEICVSI
jgi:hypothetical protein